MLDLAAQSVEADVDPGQLQQVVTNLVMNAIHASSSGGRVTVRVDESTEPRQAVRIAVEDFGSGIDPADLPRIFEPFFTTKDVGDGTGLGLAVTHGIVREHQGWIDVKSNVGVGSTFEVFIPTSRTPSSVGNKPAQGATG